MEPIIRPFEVFDKSCSLTAFELMPGIPQFRLGLRLSEMFMIIGPLSFPWVVWEAKSLKHSLARRRPLWNTNQRTSDPTPRRQIARHACLRGPRQQSSILRTRR